jgi:hypothetical protein
MLSPSQKKILKFMFCIIILEKHFACRTSVRTVATKNMFLLQLEDGLHGFLFLLTSVWTPFFVGYEKRKRQLEDIMDQAFPFRTEWRCDMAEEYLQQCSST